MGNKELSDKRFKLLDIIDNSVIDTAIPDSKKNDKKLKLFKDKKTKNVLAKFIWNEMTTGDNYSFFEEFLSDYFGIDFEEFS